MRAVATVLTLLALAACDRPQTAEPVGIADVAPDKPAPASSPPADSPFGAGRSMSGSVSGLSGLVTAFQVEETATTIVVALAADVLFAFDSADLSAQAPQELRKTVEQIARGGPGEILVIGHTDSAGEAAYNDGLSQRRAAAVAAWLAGEGRVPAARLKSEGRGEREPVAPNETATGADSPEGRAKNRRVTIVIPKG